MTAEHDDLQRAARAVLARNDRGTHTAPSGSHYPQQWLWDSAYSAIGLAHIDPARAASEITSLLLGQWANGMIPHMVEHRAATARGVDFGRSLWSSKRARFAPPGVITSGITQPPVLAEATSRVAAKLDQHAADTFLRKTVPQLVRYHEWFYRERDPLGEALVSSVHPWETGMDNTPPWTSLLTRGHQPLLVRAAATAPLRGLIERVRPDTRTVDAAERATLAEGLRSISLLLRLRRAHYDYADLGKLTVPRVQDVAVNAILIRNNAILRQLARSIEHPVPGWLLERMQQAPQSLEQLWDCESSIFLSRDAGTRCLLRPATAAGLLPLYTDELTRGRREVLERLISDQLTFGTRYPVPTVPVRSPYFRERGYWAGPTWINVNWHLIDGLQRSGRATGATTLRDQTLELVRVGGMHEYFSALDGRGLGYCDFSWTAALAIDLINQAASGSHHGAPADAHPTEPS